MAMKTFHDSSENLSFRSPGALVLKLQETMASEAKNGQQVRKQKFVQIPP